MKAIWREQKRHVPCLQCGIKHWFDYNSSQVCIHTIFFKFHIMHFHISDSQELEQDEDDEDSRGIGGNDMCFSKCVYWGKVDKSSPGCSWI